MRETTWRHQGQCRRRRGPAPGARAEIPLWVVVQPTVKQLCPCSPWGSMGDAEIHPQPVGIHGDAEIHPQPMGIHGDAEIHPQPMGIHRDAEIHPQPTGSCPCQSRVSLEEAVTPWKAHGEGTLLPGWNSLSLEGCTPWQRDSLQQLLGGLLLVAWSYIRFMESCLLWERPRGATGEQLLSLCSERNHGG